MGEIMKNVDLVLYQLSPDPLQLISREQLLKFLDYRSQQLFDRIIFEQLYSRMPKGINGQVTIQDFKRIIQEAHQSLTAKIQQSQQILDQKKQELNNCSNKLSQVTSQERYNNYNISLQSTLSVQIFDAKIQFPGDSMVYIKIGCDETMYSTKYANRKQPVWNETFTFPIQSGQEEIWLVLLDEELTQRKQIGGQVTLDLQKYSDQQVHEEELTLKDQYNVVAYSTIRVAVQWIHSQQKYLEQEIIDYQSQIGELKFDIEEYNNDLKAIFQPFSETPQQSVSQYQTQDNQIYSFKQNYNLERSSQANQEMKPSEWLKLSLIITLMLLVTAIAQSLFKAEYLDFLIIFYSLWFYMNNFELQSLLHIKIMAVMYVFSLIIDGVWLYIFLVPYLTNNIKYDHSEDTFHQYTAVICFIVILEKIIILITFLNLYQKFPQARKDIYDDQYEICFGSTFQQKLKELQPTQAQYQSNVLKPPKLQQRPKYQIRYT